MLPSFPPDPSPYLSYWAVSVFHKRPAAPIFVLYDESRAEEARNSAFKILLNPPQGTQEPLKVTFLSTARHVSLYSALQEILVSVLRHEDLDTEMDEAQLGELEEAAEELRGGAKRSRCSPCFGGGKGKVGGEEAEGDGDEGLSSGDEE